MDLPVIEGVNCISYIQQKLTFVDMFYTSHTLKHKNEIVTKMNSLFLRKAVVSHFLIYSQKVPLL